MIDLVRGLEKVKYIGFCCLFLQAKSDMQFFSFIEILSSKKKIINQM